MHEISVWVFLIVFFISSVFLSFLINGLFLKFSRSLGIRNTEETVIRWGSTSKPALGGISFYIIYLFSITIYAIYFKNFSNYLDKEFLGVLLAVTLGFLIGLADDAYNTKPFLKFAGQFACAIILIYSGVYIHIFSENYNLLNYALTIFWVVGMMNSINMLDNMDAITASVSSFILIATIIHSFIHNTIQQDVYSTIAFGVLASLIGFLYYNWNPSKMYMGDTGSQFLGVLLAAVGILFVWTGKDWTGSVHVDKQFLSVLLIFALPIIDTTTVTINRLRRGQSPFVGGKDHTTHHLSYRGYNDRQVAIIFISLAIISLLLSIFVNNYKNWNHFYTVIIIVYFLSIFGYLYLPTLKKRNAKK